MTIRSVTKGSGTNEESRKEQNKIPSPPNAGKVALAHIPIGVDRNVGELPQPLFAGAKK